jgi:hypothetical protein
MLGDPQEYRQRAVNCATRAAASSSPAIHQKFEDLAIVWLTLALELERNLGQPENPVRHHTLSGKTQRHTR